MTTEKLTSPPKAMSRISGYIYVSDGSRLKGAKVACGETETRTLADGYFVLDALVPGDLDVTANLQGFKPESKTISLHEGEEINLDFHLSKAKGTAGIHGYVYDAKSKKTVGKGGSIIIVLPISNKYGSIDKDGYYEFTNLPAGTYKILTSIQGYADNNATLKVNDAETKEHNFFCKTQNIEEPPWG
ncbi:MAG: carboxypeptidase regulatory-like domain-containing protein [Candidatus Bathyarchaeota archaeon]|nr:MAG: carboxypeptidase regulatory-like domain-containing protein [Candidatus Bathyarchaeota archaeon]